MINAAIKEHSYLLIDEPELGLHASLQTEFLSTLGSFAKNGVLFATHSMGLARSAGDYVFSVRSEGQGSILQKSASDPGLSEMVGELSFSSFRELGYDGLLLVEGGTDIKLFHELLRKYRKDQQFVVLSLGCDQLARKGVETELGEIKRITDNVFALVDSERTAAGAVTIRQGFKDSCDKLGIKCHILDLRAIENYFTDRAVKQAIGPEFHALQPYEVLNEINPSWSKTSNWRIGRAMTIEELNDTDLGQFLDEM